MNNTPILEIILIDYRWIFVILFLLPASFLYNLFYFIRSEIIFRLKTAPKNHNVKVKKIQNQIMKWRSTGMKTKMCTARPGYQTMSFRQPIYKKTMFQVNCDLIDILEIDQKRQIVRVEPQVNMGQLSKALALSGWTIGVLPELDDLTVSGLVMGTGIESSSHIHGLFQHICVSYEILLSNGNLTICTKDENPDLFYAIPWSYGTLGFLTEVEIKILPATKYIELRYEPINGLSNIVKKLEVESKNQNNDFVEGLMYNLDQGVIMTGKMIKDNEVIQNKINSIGKWYQPWFFEYVRNIMNKNEITIEYLPLRDYYHRHSRSLFWELQDIVPFGNNILFRYLFGWMMPVKVSLLKLTQTKTVKRLYENNHVLQDLLVPILTVQKCLEKFNSLVKVYPIWLCPFILKNNPGMLQSINKDNDKELYVDIGVYGVTTVNDYHPIKTTRLIEDLVKKNNGFQMLYADTYQTKEEFRQMFDHKLYDKVRCNLQCENAFPEVYDKINRNVRD